MVKPDRPNAISSWPFPPNVRQQRHAKQRRNCWPQCDGTESGGRTQAQRCPIIETCERPGLIFTCLGKSVSQFHLYDSANCNAGRPAEY